jgi:hypothetical protein
LVPRLFLDRFEKKERGLSVPRGENQHYYLSQEVSIAEIDRRRGCALCLIGTSSLALADDAMKAAVPAAPALIIVP